MKKPRLIALYAPWLDRLRDAIGEGRVPAIHEKIRAEIPRDVAWDDVEWFGHSELAQGSKGDYWGEALHVIKVCLAQSVERGLIPDLGPWESP